MSRLNFVPIRSDPRTIFLSGNRPLRSSMHGRHHFYQGQLKSKASGFQKNLKSKTYQAFSKAIVISEAHFVKVEW